ncbi:A-kinase anchor protein 2-like [Bombina bombina]|uniref:A-kinase anchor protein 2-like n=1 Tax=Bombina bombina TaxID=8345 RepID=UPI00235AFC2B|nr:A-kinase anchor protein 2-like [Bombina bombina]
MIAAWMVMSMFTKSQITEDEIKLKKDREHSANLTDHPRFILTSKETMELEVPVEHKGVVLVASDGQSDNQAGLLSAAASHNGLKDRHESIDSDVAKEIRYLDEVLEANCCDSSTDTPFNGSPSPEPNTITVDGSGPYVIVTNNSLSTVPETIAVDRKPLPVVDIESSECTIKMNGHSQNELKEEHVDEFTYAASPTLSNGSRRSSKDGEITPKTIRKEAKFELRAFHEEKKPSKLFDNVSEKEAFRVRKVRPTEEVIELEKERLELIKSQAVKKNPGIATKWWNPPQEKTIEEQLNLEHLESHIKYKERKQKQQQQGAAPPEIKSNPVPVVPSESIVVNKEDIVTEQIDFSAARKQFLSMENTNQQNLKVPKRSVTSNLYSVKPFYKLSNTAKPQSSVTVTNPSSTQVQLTQAEADEISLVKAQKVHCISEDQSVASEIHLLETSSGEVSGDENMKCGKTVGDESEFLNVPATLTVVKDDENYTSDRFSKSVIIASPPEELDSGLDDLSVKSQDTTVMETLSNDFSMDNISDSGTSNETMNALNENSLGEFSQPQTPLNDTLADYTLDENSKSFSDLGFYSPSSMFPDSVLLDDNIEYHAGLLVQSVIQQALAEKAGMVECTKIQDSADTNFTEDNETLEEQNIIETTSTPPLSPENKDNSVFEPPQVSSPMPEMRGVTVTPKSTEQNLELSLEKKREYSPVPPVMELEGGEEYKQESYFSKYSQAAELRSTASILATQEPEITVGPFKLRSKKQRTLSMIEEEIRAAQDREQELKRQRQSLQTPPSPTVKNAPALPTRTVTYKTAPDKELK